MGFLFGYLPLIIIVSLFVSILWLIYRQYSQRVRLPPGPFPYPLIGNLLMFRGSKTPLYVQVAELSKTYGDPITIWFGPYPTVFLNTVESVRKALIDNQHDFANRPTSLIGDMFTQGTPDIAFGDYNAEWRVLKKIAVQCLRKVIDSTKLEKEIVLASRDIIENLLEQPATIPIDISNHTTNITFNVLATFCFGQRYQLDDPKFVWQVKALQEQTDATNNLLLVEILPGARSMQWLLTKMVPSVRLINGYMLKRRNYSHEYLTKHRQLLAQQQDIVIGDILDALIVEQISLKQQSKMGLKNYNLTDDHIVNIIEDIFGAGTETTTLTLGWFFLEMVLNPEIQEDCSDQIRQVLENREPSISDRSSLSILEASIMETLRLHPPAPFGVPHTPTQAAWMADKYWIPEGTVIMTNQYAIHHSEAYWKDPETFNPRRFIDGDGTVLKPAAWIPFGVGRRVCLGEQLAKNNLFLITANLLQRLRFKPVETESYTRKANANSDFGMKTAENFKYLVERR